MREAETEPALCGLVAVSAATIAAVLLLGIAGTSIGLVRANRARHEAETQRGLTVIEAEKAQALSDFLDAVSTALAVPHEAYRARRRDGVAGLGTP